MKQWIAHKQISLLNFNNFDQMLAFCLTNKDKLLILLYTGLFFPQQHAVLKKFSFQGV